MGQASAALDRTRAVPVGERMVAYVDLAKPRIIGLLLVTTVPAMFLAAEGWPSPWLVFATLLGGAMTAASANAFNMVIDRDIDAIMARTKGRPLPSHRLSVTAATNFAAILCVLGPVWLALTVNLLAAGISAAATVFYVNVYTSFLKRRTPQNIVIGGAAGAVPALVGWAAVTHDVSAAAWLLFAVVFLWTPPHFWALAVAREEDYAAVGVPMLPVVKGREATARSSYRYALMTVAASLLLPFFHPHVGWVYVVASSCLGALVVGRAAAFRRSPDETEAYRLFGFSIVYLGGVSMALLLDQILPPHGP